MTGVEMDMKEFSHTNDLIENAEEWMARVREVLESGEPATLHGLEALLTEAEGIPVTMDEQQLLTVGIKARQWRLRVDNTLAGGRAKLHELQDLAAKVRFMLELMSCLNIRRNGSLRFTWVLCLPIALVVV